MVIHMTLVRICSDRTSQTLLLAAVLLVGSAVCLRGPFPADARDDIYYKYHRLQWKSEADVVLIGDSRTMIGVSPGAMSDSLLGLRIRNFAFGAVGYSDQYMDAAEATLDQADGAKIIVMGITPRSLRRVATRDNQFIRSVNSMSRYNYWKAGWSGVFHHYWRPWRADEARDAAANPITAPRHHLDGWVEPLPFNVNPAVSLRHYEEICRDGIDREIVDGLLARVRDWSKCGIRVYAFRPPTCEEMVALETDFAESSFANAFEDAGGRWLTPSNEGLKTYDASHLDLPSTLLLSRRLAHVISFSEKSMAHQSRPLTDSVTQ